MIAQKNTLITQKTKQRRRLEMVAGFRNGFKLTVDREEPKQFFKVRLWNPKTIIIEIFTNYDKLSDEIKAEIPLKRVWVLL